MLLLLIKDYILTLEKACVNIVDGNGKLDKLFSLW